MRKTDCNRYGHLWDLFQGPSCSRDRVIVSVSFEMGISAIHVSPSILGIQFKGLGVVVYCQVNKALTPIGNASIEVGLSVVGTYFDSLVVKKDGLLVCSVLELDCSHAKVSFGIIRGFSALRDSPHENSMGIIMRTTTRRAQPSCFS